MKLYLYDLNAVLCKDLQKEFNTHKEVEVLNCSFYNLPKIDCIVSPANSFGFMTGGLDGVLTNYFGEQLMDRVQKYISKKYYGLQPIGTSFIIETNDINNKHKYLAHTPTMVLPENISYTNNVYFAMRALLIEALKYKDILSIACSGLGTATGGVNFSKAAKQMRLAYEHIKYNIGYINMETSLKQYVEIGLTND